MTENWQVAFSDVMVGSFWCCEVRLQGLDMQLFSFLALSLKHIPVSANYLHILCGLDDSI